MKTTKVYGKDDDKSRWSLLLPCEAGALSFFLTILLKIIQKYNSISCNVLSIKLGPKNPLKTNRLMTKKTSQDFSPSHV